MNLGYRGRLFFISLVLTLLVVGVSGFYLNQSLKEWVEQHVSAELSRHGRTAQLLLRGAGESGGAIEALADDLSEATGSRVEVFGSKGELLGDSLRDRGQLRLVPPLDDVSMESWRAQIASRGEYSATVLESPGEPESVQVVRPWGSLERGGYVRLSVPLSEVDALKRRVRLLLFIAAGLGLVVAVLMSGLASYLMSRTLRELILQVQRMLHAGDSPILGYNNQPVEERVGATRRSDGEELETMRSITQLSRELSSRVEVLGRERDEFRLILESMDEGVLALDRSQCVRLMNRAAREMFEPQLALFDQSRLSEQHVTDLIRVPVFLDLLEEANRGRKSMAEFRLSGPPERQVVAHVTPQRGGGAVLVLHDVSELRKLERVRKDFIANVSHELRTPVSVIMLNSETLMEDAELLASSRHARRFVEGMHRNAERLSRLISDLLDISRLEAGRFRLEKEPISVLGAALRVMDTLEDRAEGKGQEMDTDIDVGLLVFADAKALDQMLFNLVDNAIKYAPEGGKIVVRARAMEVESERERDYVRIEVCDDGPGLSAQHRARIFERFYRVDEGRARDVGGTGLGLSIVKHFAEALGGRVGVMPNKPVGSIFWMRLPRAQKHDEVAIEVAQPVEVTTAAAHELTYVEGHEAARGRRGEEE